MVDRGLIFSSQWINRQKRLPQEPQKPLCSTIMTNLCNSVQSLIERFQPAHGHVAHRQLLVMRNMLCMGNVGQYAALPAIAFGGYFSPFFCNKNLGIYAVDFLEFAQCHGSQGNVTTQEKNPSKVVARQIPCVFVEWMMGQKLKIASSRLLFNSIRTSLLLHYPAYSNLQTLQHHRPPT